MRSARGAAASFVPACALLGVSGAIIGQGHDALAVSLGLAGAAFLWAAGFQPAAGTGAAASDLPTYLARRYDCPTVATLATAVLAVAYLFLLTAELTALAGALAAVAPALPVSPLAALTATLVGASLLQALLPARFENGPALFLTAAVPLAILALLASLAALSGHDGPGVLVSVPTLADVGTLERALLTKHLADPANFKPFASPFLRTDMLNTLAAVTCVSIGMAILTASSQSGDAQTTPRMRVRAMTLAIATLVLIPALAVAARRALLAVVDGGVTATMLPGWIANLSAGSALQVCGARAPADAATIANACGKGVGAQGFMRWHDFAFAPDSVLMAALSSQTATMLAAVAAALMAGAAVLAALATARSAASAVSKAAKNKYAVLAITVAAWLSAAGFATLSPAPSASLLVWAAALAAAGLAPALVLAPLVATPSKHAALTAITVGTLTALSLILVTRYDALDALAFTKDFAPLSPPALRKLSTLWSALGNAQGEAAQAPILAQMQDLARENVSWLGLKQLAAGAWGLAAGLVVMLAGQAVSAIAGLRKRT